MGAFHIAVQCNAAYLNTPCSLQVIMNQHRPSVCKHITIMCRHLLNRGVIGVSCLHENCMKKSILRKRLWNTMRNDGRRFVFSIGGHSLLSPSLPLPFSPFLSSFLPSLSPSPYFLHSPFLPFCPASPFKTKKASLHFLTKVWGYNPRKNFCSYGCKCS